MPEILKIFLGEIFTGVLSFMLAECVAKLNNVHASS